MICYERAGGEKTGIFKIRLNRSEHKRLYVGLMGIENLHCILRFLHTLDSLNFDKNAGGLMRTGKFGKNLKNFEFEYGF